MATILTIIPYSFYPPTGGGALRCFYLLREMSYQHTVYLLTVQQEQDFEQGFPPFPKNVHIVSVNTSRIYRSIFNFLPSKFANAINFRILNRSLKGSTDTSFLQVFPVLNSLLYKVKFDVIFYENLEALSLFGKMINSKSPESIKVYDAHNVDSTLWLQKSITENNNLFKHYARKALSTEKSLFKKADFFFSCSDKDKGNLTKLNKNRIKGFIIPNGVDTAVNPFDINAKKYTIKNIIFCGSLDYFPNLEGLLWFYQNVFQILKEKQPDISLTVVGNLTKAVNYTFLKNDPFVKFIGKVESVVPYYHHSSVSVVPLKSGSGTRLKILEAMSLGNPVVSTSVGAEGLDYIHEKNLLIADEPVAFANHVLALLNNKTLFDEIRIQAMELAKDHYDWKEIGIKVNEVFGSLPVTKKDIRADA